MKNSRKEKRIKTMRDEMRAYASSIENIATDLMRKSYSIADADAVYVAIDEIVFDMDPDSACIILNVRMGIEDKFQQSGEIYINEDMDPNAAAGYILGYMEAKNNS